ncbi:hypothetical protein DFR50_109125 [Roseiarcus fermentans]|uniref:Cell pole-organizing protein PopZ n=2 Tax=Roseiarcus fermentans TaxID=1473586 RepID=A0A366FI85_9HYPH|nr:hypothetical protein DFR50_109125 [Roseiarcus fermentans]
MEEILASIRTIIAEERQPAGRPEPKGAPVSAAAVPMAPQIVFSKSDSAPRSPSQRAEPAPESNAPKAASRQAEPEAVVPPPPPAATTGSPAPAAAISSGAHASDDAPLLSAEAGKAVASAFDALSASLAQRSTEVAEGVAREMLRPMLKAWLDENLPAIVERLVRAEIERISQSTR